MNKLKIGLGLSIILLVAFVAGGVWYYTVLQQQIDTLTDEKEGLQDLANTFETEKTNLQNQVNTLHREKNSLNTTYQEYVSTYSHSNSEYDALNNEKSSLQAQVNTLQTDKTNLQKQIDALKVQANQVDALQKDITNLRKQINTLNAPLLIKINLEETDRYSTDFWGSVTARWLHVKEIVVNVGTNAAYNRKLHVTMYQSGGLVAKETDISIYPIMGNYWAIVETDIPYLGNALTSWTVMPTWKDAFGQ